MTVRPGHTYRAVVRVGSTVWDVEKGDAPTFGPMLPLNIGWQMPQTSEPLPAPEPMTCALSLILEAADDADAYDIGTHVYVRMFLGVDDGAPTFTPLPSVVFAGRIAQMEGHPRRVNGTDAYQLDLTCVDYTADLAEYEVAGEIPFQGIGVAAWVDQLFLLAGLSDPDWTDGGFGCAQLTLDGGKLQPSSLLAAVERLLSTYADGGGYTGDESNRMNHASWATGLGWRRGMLTPVIDEDTGELLSWSVEFYSRYNHLSGGSFASTFPMVLVDDGGLYDLVLDRPDYIPDVLDLTQVLDAGYVDFGATWKRTKNTAPTVVIVTNNSPPEDYLSTDWKQAAEYTTEDRPQVANRVTDFMGYERFNAEFAGELLLPDVVPYRDVADGFTYYASADPAWPVIPSWFPGTHQLWFGFALPILVTNIPDSQNPGPHRPGFNFYPGTLAGCVFRLEPGGTFRFDLTLKPGAPMPGGPVGGSVDWAQLQVDDPPLGSITVDDLHPDLTVHDVRLARRSAAP